MRRPWLRVIMIIAGAGLLAIFAMAVWPTAWRDRVVTVATDSFTARQSRFTGEVRVLCVDGWHRLAEDPFADWAPAGTTEAQRRDPCRSAPFAKPSITGSR